MTGSMTDLFPPEMQTVFAAAAALSAVTGLFYWAAGIKIARISAALLMGVTGAGVAAWGLPGPTGISAITAAIVGFVAGVLAGAVTFRLLQGVVLAMCVAVAAMGVYWRIQESRGERLTTNAAVLPEGARGGTPATLKAQEMLIPADRLGGAEGTWGKQGGAIDAGRVLASARQVGSEVGGELSARWLEIPALHRQRMTVLAILAAGVGLLLGLLFPRPTTWIITAASGTVMLISAGYGLLTVFGPQYLPMIPGDVKVRWGIAAAIMLIGMLLQRMLFWPAGKKKGGGGAGVAASGTALEAPKAF
jgi:hypothetical protein